jgi:hypothetical protein
MTPRGKQEAPRERGFMKRQNEEGFLKPCRIMRFSPKPTAVPALGHDVNPVYRTHPKDLLAQKQSLFAPSTPVIYPAHSSESIIMDLGIIVAIAMLIVWAVGTFAFEAPGWIHLLLTLGVFLLIWRTVVRGDPERPHPPRPSTRPPAGRTGASR